MSDSNENTVKLVVRCRGKKAPSYYLSVTQKVRKLGILEMKPVVVRKPGEKWVMFQPYRILRKQKSIQHYIPLDLQLFWAGLYKEGDELIVGNFRKLPEKYFSQVMGKKYDMFYHVEIENGWFPLVNRRGLVRNFINEDRTNVYFPGPLGDPDDYVWAEDLRVYMLNSEWEKSDLATRPAKKLTAEA